MTTKSWDSGNGSAGSAITLEELIALNDEIVALVRAGVPLERGLLLAAADLRGRLGALASALGERLKRGETLTQALAAERASVPPVYRAVVEAGLRAGRLPVALEGLARFARTYAELRRVLGLALLYPLLVLMLAYGLFVLFVLVIAPRFEAAFTSLRLPALDLIRWLAALGDSVPVWGPIVPALIVLLGFWWYLAGRAAVLQPGRWSAWVRRVPWMRGLLAATEAANFADLLALLLEHQVPFPAGIVLAAEASADAKLLSASRELAASAERGEPLRASVHGTPSLPPLLAWLMLSGQSQGDLVSALRHAAATYRRRALDRAELIRLFLPTLLMLAIGATATLLFALTLFLPLINMLKDLAKV